MCAQRTSPRPYFPDLQTSIPTSNQELVSVNHVHGQLSLQRTSNQDLALVNQALGQHIVEGNENQWMTSENVALLVNGMQGLQELVQKQASELQLIKEKLRMAELQKEETAEAFEAYKNASNETMKVLLEKIAELKQQVFFELQGVARREAISEARFLNTLIGTGQDIQHLSRIMLWLRKIQNCKILKEDDDDNCSKSRWVPVNQLQHLI